jgi:hypothetical protein
MPIETKQPFCGFCNSLGFNNNHWMRTRINGYYKTICPELLKTQCQNCYKMGHTMKYCTKKDKTTDYFNKTTAISQINESKTKEKKNLWSYLCVLSDSDSDSDSEEYNNLNLNTYSRYVKKRWEDYDEDDNELPPIPFSWLR